MGGSTNEMAPDDTVELWPHRADLQYVQIRTNTLFAHALLKHAHGGSVPKANTPVSSTSIDKEQL
jgi:hypothetical protein